MCRWFAYISSSEPCLLEDVLVTPAHALSKQVHEHYLPKLLSHDPAVHAEHTTEAEITTRNRLFNVDGFGMAWYTATLSGFSPASTESSSTKPDLHPALYKTIQPPLHDSNFRSICSNTASKVVFAHIRAATATAITPTNNHPFTFGVHTIMHNGFISDFALIKRKMGEAMTQEAYSHIQGGTDTEHFAALFMSFLCPSSQAIPTPGDEGEGEVPAAWEQYHSPQELHAALSKTIAAVINIQTTLLGPKAQPSDLNIAVTDGKSLVACRFRNHATEQPPSLYYSSTAGVTLNRQYPDHPDGAKGPHGSGKGKSANGKKAVEGAEGHNPHAKKNAGEHGSHVIVASEPTTYKDAEWTLIEKNHVVLVGSGGKIEVEHMSYPGDGKTS
ncbi:putative glutamine amidotransferase DUG3 [Lachnellula suecica]|uniref:Putative glutamine amidotransferase DUG3 n=1 Tax=Lachnellula suecica TaxID=602035 RepID=A0A8T9C5S1_9HELO|nr:putative glutamine amidotransferase DUG3 [Lachnellula suecica]